ncbi:hypothetical protein RJ641_010460 [Dillenia turbinata]|uniref:Uncharacterized protein n=1 Tax=Dillenia turbinata TaxID=194707 RepID=A0AAN8UYJ1_9MAGN
MCKVIYDEQGQRSMMQDLSFYGGICTKKHQSSEHGKKKNYTLDANLGNLLEKNCVLSNVCDPNLGNLLEKNCCLFLRTISLVRSSKSSSASLIGESRLHKHKGTSSASLSSISISNNQRLLYWTDSNHTERTAYLWCCLHEALTNK